MTSPIDRYLQALGAQLDLSAVERAAALEEVRAHLEAKAASLREAGRSPLEAEQAAVGAFGDSHFVARRISAAHPARWNRRRWLSSMGLGALLTWGIWMLGTFPVLAYQVYTHALAYPQDSRPTTAGVLMQSTPLTGGGWFAFNAAGWLWLTPLLILFFILPFFWGLRSGSWWAPGFAYGLGAWIAAPWFVMVFFVPSLSYEFRDEAILILLAAPVAAVVSGLGHLIGSGRQPDIARQLAS